MNNFEKQFEELKKADLELSKKTRNAVNFTEEELDRLDNEWEKAGKEIERKAEFNKKLKNSPILVIIFIIIFIIFAYFIV